MTPALLTTFSSFTGPQVVESELPVHLNFGQKLDLQFVITNWGKIPPKSAIILIPSEVPADGFQFETASPFCGSPKLWFVQGPILSQSADETREPEDEKGEETEEDWSGDIKTLPMGSLIPLKRKIDVIID